MYTKGLLTNIALIQGTKHYKTTFEKQCKSLASVTSMNQIRATLISILILAALSVPSRTFAAFGLTTTTDYYQVDTGAGLVFKVRRVEESGVNPNTVSIGDIRSLVYNGVEYQDTARGSQINSGFDYLGYPTSTVNVTAETIGSDYIKITVTTDDLIHYYIAKNGDPCIYMATWYDVEPVSGGGLCRYIVRMPYSNLPNGPEPSDNNGTDYTVESGDIFGFSPSNSIVELRGRTSSKHYSNHRMIDWDSTGATGDGVGVFMVRDSQEGGSGGPFYRSLINQGGGDQEITYIINYGEAQTEAFRPGTLNGIYTLVFTDGHQPDPNIDYGWVDSAGLNLTNWYPASARGTVSGTASGIPDGFETVVGFANSTAQYWAKTDADGHYITQPMIPGTYTATLYKQELEVATDTVNVTAGNTNTLDLASTESTPSVIWRIGDWDGTPRELRNGDKITYMHPSDVRMDDWNPWPFNIETDVASDFPSVQFRGTNSPAVITFNLDSGEVADMTLRIGTTAAYNNGRPQVTVNSTDLGYPGAPDQPSTRTITVGTYRGNNIAYSYSISSSALVAGQNTIYITPVSGNADLGPWLSASWSYDAIELDGTPSAVPSPPSGLSAIPRETEIELLWDQTPSATHYLVQRAPTADGPYTTLSDNAGAARFLDTSATNGTTYFYRVSAINAQGESGYALVAATPAQLMTHFKFDETSGSTAEDSIAGNNAALMSGASWTAGAYSNAVQLDGSANGYVELPDGIMEDLTDCTISTWVNASSTPTWSRIFDFGMGTESYMFLSPNAYNGGSGTVRFAITIASNHAGSEQQLNSGSPLPLNGWHHIAVTLSGDTGKLYIDGSLADTQTITLDPADLGLTRHNFIGRSQWGDTPPTAKIDDFRIYDRALSDSEISIMASQTPPPAPADLTASATTNEVTLSWPASGGAATYNIMRATTNGGPYTLIAGGIAGTSFTYLSAHSGVYDYVVTAENLAGVSTPSPEAELLVVKIPSQPVTPASPIAFYRFEEGPAGSTVIPLANSVMDSAGDDDNMTAYNAAAAPDYNAVVPMETIPQTGETNTLSTYFDGSDDLYNALIGRPLTTTVFTDFTVEAYVKFSSTAGFQTIVGRDDSWNQTGGQDGNSQSLFYLSKHIDNHFRVEVSTVGGDMLAVEGTVYAAAGAWYHVAAVGDASAGTLKLYVNGQLAGSVAGFDGLYDPAEHNAWTIGRGQYNGYVADNLSGWIDEVRFCGAALSPEQFLNASNTVEDDSDVDGMSDVFENYYFGNLAQTGTDDPDGDGNDNATEQANGTSPIISSIPPIIDLSISTGQLNLYWPSNNTGWRLLSRTNLISGDWVEVSGSDTNNTYGTTLNSLPSDSMFYKLVYP